MEAAREDVGETSLSQICFRRRRTASFATAFHHAGRARRYASSFDIRRNTWFPSSVMAARNAISRHDQDCVTDETWRETDCDAEPCWIAISWIVTAAREL